MGGDLNIVLNPMVDKKSVVKKAMVEQLSKAATEVTDFLEEYEWMDVWRHIHPNEKQFTWSRKKPSVFSRLDYWLMPVADLGSVTGCEIVYNVISDHNFMELELNVDTVLRATDIGNIIMHCCMIKII